MDETPESPLCSKCEAPLDTAGYPLWCKQCRAANMREYTATKKQMQESRGFAAGVSAMRDYLAGRFREYGTQGSFTGNEVAHFISQSHGPNAIRTDR
jgi:hypothetical protein